jgi:hypothetical protein
MSRPARMGESFASRALIALMRAVPALFTLGWLAAAVVWLVQGRVEHALAALAVALVAASFGARIAVFTAATRSGSRKGLARSGS